MSEYADMRFSAQEYAALLDWFMVSDPWPIESNQERVIKDMLNDEARERDYDSWVHAYHEFNA